MKTNFLSWNTPLYLIRNRLNIGHRIYIARGHLKKKYHHFPAPGSGWQYGASPLFCETIFVKFPLFTTQLCHVSTCRKKLSLSVRQNICCRRTGSELQINTKLHSVNSIYASNRRTIFSHKYFLIINSLKSALSFPQIAEWILVESDSCKTIYIWRAKIQSCSWDTEALFVFAKVIRVVQDQE